MRDKLIKLINSCENTDENVKDLQQAALMYCSPWELCAAYKQALINEINDQYDNHYNDVDQDADAKEIYDILK